MTRDEVLKLLKKQYSEKFSHLCRDLFPTLLEEPDYFYNLIINSFEPSEFLYDDLIENAMVDDFRKYICSKADIIIERKSTSKTPAELLKEAGYTLYECKTDKDIQEFKKYYASDEELCTFGDDRLARCHVFFAVKDNVDEIKREDFAEPKRQDEYGTSVISIQFTKDSSNTLSIKNRYNHTVNNPDATFSNNLDNIIPGLTNAFNKYYHFKSEVVCRDFELPNYVKANDGKFYKYNLEINNTYYCPNNVIISNYEVERYDKEKYIVMDYFILDLQKDKKEINLHSSLKYEIDAFDDSIGEIESVRIDNDKETKNKIITINNNIIITLNKFNEIIGYSNPVVEKIDSFFLTSNRKLEIISLPKVKTIRMDFLEHNIALKKVDLPNVEWIDSCFLRRNNSLTELSLPKVKHIGMKFLKNNDSSLVSIDLPNVEHIGHDFLAGNNKIKHIDLPNCEEIYDEFMYFNKSVQTIRLPKVKRIGSWFMCDNNSINAIDFPFLEKIDGFFLPSNNSITSINLPKINSFNFEEFLKNSIKLKYINGQEVDSKNKYKVLNAILYDNFHYPNGHKDKDKKI